MTGGFYSSDIGLFDLLCFFLFFNLLLSFGLFDCQFILNLKKFFIVRLHDFSNGFGKTKTLVQLTRLEKVIDISTADGGHGSYRLLVDGSSFDGDGIFAANYGYSENGNLFDSIIFNRAI